MRTDNYTTTRRYLELIPRFQRKKLMFYRSNVALHEQRVLAIAKEIYTFAEKSRIKINKNLLETFAEIHDDFAIIDSEYAQEEMHDHRQELRTLHSLNGNYNFTRRGFDSRETLIRFRQRTDLEAQLIEYLNLFNGLAEAVHEVSAGNDLFVDIPNAQREKLTAYSSTHEKFALLCGKGHPLFDIEEFDRKKLIFPRKFHTLQTLAKASGYAPYDFWRTAIINQASLDVFESLIEVKEGKPRPLLIQQKFQIASPTK